MKTRMFFRCTILVVMLTAVVSCKHDRFKVFASEKVTDTRALKGFEKVEINGSPSVCYTQADTFSVVVKGPKNVVENILTEVSGSTLKIRNRGKLGIINVNISNGDVATVYVTSPDLIDIRLNGSGDFICESRIDSDNMNIQLRGSGDIDIEDLICDGCQTSVVGSGDLNVKRLEAKDVSASLVGSGNINLGLWKVDVTRLKLMGSGDIDADFNAGSKRVECELRGSGDITLTGDVSHFSQHKSGSGDVDVKKLVVR